MQCCPNTLIYIKTNFFLHLVRSISEVVAQRCSVKKMLLEISQYSQENTCVRVSFLIELQACNFIKKETLTQAFSCEFCEIFNNTFSYRTSRVAASDISIFLIQDLKNLLSLEDDKEHI